MNIVKEKSGFIELISVRFIYISFNLFGYCKFIFKEMNMLSMILKIWSRICHFIKTKQVISFGEAMQSTASKKNCSNVSRQTFYVLETHITFTYISIDSR